MTGRAADADGVEMGVVLAWGCKFRDRRCHAGALHVLALRRGALRRPAVALALAGVSSRNATILGVPNAVGQARRRVEECAGNQQRKTEENSSAACGHAHDSTTPSCVLTSRVLTSCVLAWSPHVAILLT